MMSKILSCDGGSSPPESCFFKFDGGFDAVVLSVVCEAFMALAAELTPPPEALWAAL